MVVAWAKSPWPKVRKIKMLSSSVVPPGPPSVVACTTSKPFMEPSSDVATLNVTAGASRGKRMLRKVCHQLAPSSREASRTSPLMVFRPAR